LSIRLTNYFYLYNLRISHSPKSPERCIRPTLEMGFCKIKEKRL